MTRFIRSFRWQLQLWHSLLLLVVLVAFCSMAVFLEHQTMMRRIDQQLRSYAGGLIDQLRRTGEPDHDRRPAPPGLRPAPEAPPAEMAATEGVSQPAWEAAPYYLVWSDGRILRQSAHLPPGRTTSPLPLVAGETFRLEQNCRELLLSGPHGLRLLVGRDIRADLIHAHLHMTVLIGAGAGVMLAGVAGGWWIARRAIRPIVTISATAEKIAAGNLRERIDTTRFATEFGALAGTLNHTFDRLQSTLQRQMQFTADASHELRTPVSVMLLASQSALSRERSAAEYRETIETCQGAAQRMRHLVEQLLLLARLDADADRPHRQPVDLHTIVAATLGLLQPLALEHGVVFRTALAPLQVEGDASQLAQVVTNLVSNAIHHSPRGAQIRIELAAQAGRAVLAVIDHGEGIAAGDLPRIFDRFYRADKARQRSDGRTGLGLAIAKAIVAAHHGRIDVQSELARGSTFTVVLPLSGLDASKPAA